METFRTYCSIDLYGRLNVVSSTQIVFHARRIIANALDIPKSMVRVTKPRIGGGFGAKQTAGLRGLPGLRDLEDQASPPSSSSPGRRARSPPRPATRWRSICASARTRMARIRGLDLYTLSNTGAYGEHGPTTVGLSGHKSIPLYSSAEAFRFTYDVVYTNHHVGGRLPGLRRDPGPVRGGIRRQRAGREAPVWTPSSSGK